MTNKSYITNSLKLGVSLAVLTVSLTACFPKEEENTTNAALDIRQTTAQNFARGFSQHFALAQQALVSNPDWKDGSLQSGLIDFNVDENLASLASTTLEYSNSAVCRLSSDPNDPAYNSALHVSWINSADDTNYSALKGLGRAGSGAILTELQRNSEGALIGRYDTELGNIQILNISGAATPDTINLPGTCSSVAALIPDNAPMLISASLSIPQENFANLTSFEYQVNSCDDPSQTGQIVERREVQQNNDGSVTEISPFTVFSDTCTNDLRATVAALRLGDVTSASNLLNGAGAGAQAGSALEELEGVNCESISSQGFLQDDDGNPVLDDEGNPVAVAESVFNTCTGAIAITEDQDIQIVSTETDVETLTTECGIGDTAPFVGIESGDSGTATVDPSGWQGSATYERTIITDTMTVNGVEVQTSAREELVGATLNCTREEALIIDCNTRVSELSEHELTDDEGFRYNRTNEVSGWADTEELIPSGGLAPDEGWEENTYACAWRNDEDFDNIPAGFVETGQGQFREEFETTNFAGAFTTSAPVSLTASTGQNITSVPAACPTGQVGSRSLRTTQTSSAPLPGDTPTITTSTAFTGSTCATPPPPRDFSDVGCCFITGTKVLMADGTEKNIEDIKVGMVLLGANDAKNTVKELHTPALAGRSLFSINGSTHFVTAEHPFMTTEGWKSLDPKQTQQESHGLIVEKLKIGDTLITKDAHIKIETIAEKTDAQEQTVYNFELDGDNTYYADNYLVHNKGGTCFAADTLILMSDGSLKRIADVEKGDETAYGSVIRKTNNLVKPEDIFQKRLGQITSSGLYSFDGINITATHNYRFGKNDWRDISDHPLTRPIHMTQEINVYNLVTESSCIPVMGQSGIQIFADYDNNRDNLSEAGYNSIQKSYTHQKKA